MDLPDGLLAQMHKIKECMPSASDVLIMQVLKRQSEEAGTWDAATKTAKYYRVERVPNGPWRIACWESCQDTQMVDTLPDRIQIKVSMLSIMPIGHSEKGVGHRFSKDVYYVEY